MKLTRLTKGSLGRTVIRCIEKGWVRMGGTVRDHRLVPLFELNPLTASVGRVNGSLVVTRTQTAPFARDKLRKLEVAFTPYGAAKVRRHIVRPVAHHPDNIEVWEGGKPVGNWRHGAQLMQERDSATIGTPPCSYCRVGWNENCRAGCECVLCRTAGSAA